MSTQIKDIVKEALSRANVISRAQQVPLPIGKTAFNLLKGIASKFSNDNLLQFLRREVDFTPTAEVLKIGDSDGADVVDVQAPNLADIKSVYIKIGDSDYEELDFVAYEDFHSGDFGDYVYSWQEFTDKYGKIYFKPQVVNGNYTVKVVYNVKWDFDENSTLHVPEKYIELFNCALAHKLAINFPRLSPQKTAELKAELEEMIENIKVSTRANKIIQRKGDRSYSYNDFLAGRFL